MVTTPSGVAALSGAVLVSAGEGECTTLVSAGQCSQSLTLAWEFAKITNSYGDETYTPNQSAIWRHVVKGLYMAFTPLVVNSD